MTMVWFDERSGKGCGFNLEHLLFTYETDKGTTFLQFRDEMYTYFDVDVSVIKDAILKATKVVHGLLVNSEDKPIDYVVSPTFKVDGVVYSESKGEDPLDIANEYIDDMTRFIHEHCVIGYPDDVVSEKELYAAYCAMPNKLEMSLYAFGRDLSSYETEYGLLEKRKFHGNMHYVGIRLKGE